MAFTSTSHFSVLIEPLTYRYLVTERTKGGKE